MGERQCSTEDLTITMYMRSYTKLQSGVSSVIRLDLERSKGILHTHANRQTERGGGAAKLHDTWPLYAFVALRGWGVGGGGT